MTPSEAHARMIELRRGIARCKKLNVVEFAEDLEKEWQLLRDTYMRQAYP